MKKLSLGILILMIFLNLPIDGADAADPRVRIETNYGNIVMELYPDTAPKTVANFLHYVNSGFYDGTIFHRVIKGFMIQGGGFTLEMQQKSTQTPIINEAANGLKNKRGTVAMARTSQPDSATAQFFINTADNAFLDHRDKTPAGWGYCVFGKVVDGIKVVDTIEKLPTGQKGMHRDVPIEPVVVTRVLVIGQKAQATGNQ